MRTQDRRPRDTLDPGARSVTLDAAALLVSNAGHESASDSKLALPSIKSSRSVCSTVMRAV